MMDFNKEAQDNLKETIERVKKLMEDSQAQVHKGMKELGNNKETAPYKALFQEYINKIDNGEVKSSDIEEIRAKFNNLGSRG